MAKVDTPQSVDAVGTAPAPLFFPPQARGAHSDRW
jgi:hypothetical protein